MGAEILEPRRSKAWTEQALGAIDVMRSNAPRLPLRVYPLNLAPAERGCFEARQLDLVSRRVWFRAKGEDRTVTVRLQRIVFVHLLRAMIEEPAIVIGFGAATTATFRTTTQQRTLYEIYQAGGSLAAPPCSSFHEKGISLDGFYWSQDERDVMREHGFYDLLPQDPPHYTFGVRG